MEPIVNNGVATQQESFFDKHIVKLLLLLNIISLLIFFIFELFANVSSVFLENYLAYICLLLPTLVVIILWIINYNNKRVELLRLIIILSIPIFILLLFIFYLTHTISLLGEGIEKY